MIRGYVLNDFASPDVFAGATFFGVVNDQTFSAVRFDFTGSEAIGFDFLQFGTVVAVPEPATLGLFCLGLAGLGFSLLRRQRS